MAPKESFQSNVREWCEHTFGVAVSNDLLERADRALEESLELAQTVDGMDAARAHALVDYVFGRPKGCREQEFGGVMVTTAAFAAAANVDLMHAAEYELARCWKNVDVIRKKQSEKPHGSALPVAGEFRLKRLVDPSNGEDSAPGMGHAESRLNSAVAKLNAELQDEIAKRVTAEKRAAQFEEQLRDLTTPSGGEFGRATGVDLIARERASHPARGYGSGHDDEHTEGELARAACVYAMPPIDYAGGEFEIANALWPADWEMPDFVTDESNPARVRELAIAGSLIAAEIDRRIRRGDRIAEMESKTPVAAGDVAAEVTADLTTYRQATLRFTNDGDLPVIAVASMPLARLTAIAEEFAAHPPMPEFVPRKTANTLLSSVPEEVAEAVDIASAGEFETAAEPESKRVAIDVPLHKVAPSTNDKPHEFHMAGVAIHGVPIAMLLDRAVKDLLGFVEMRRIRANEPPSTLDREGTVEFARAVLDAHAKLTRGEGPFTLDACFAGRDIRNDPLPGDTFVVDGVELLVVERRQDIMLGKDFVTFAPIIRERVRPTGLFGFGLSPEHTERAGNTSTVELDVFAASVSTAEDVGERGPRLLSHWTAIRLAPGCVLNAATGAVEVTSKPEFVAPDAVFLSEVAPVYADGSIGPSKIVKSSWSDAVFSRFADALGASVAGMAREFGHRDSEKTGDHE